jgi:putative DNA primase/helicase
MSKIDTDELLSQVDIVDVIGRYGVELKKSGSEYKALCPFHSENTPSFTVVPDRQFYQCFGCDAKGDAIDFVRHHQGLEFRDAAEQIRLIAGGEMPMIADGHQPAQSEPKQQPPKVWQDSPDPDNTPPPATMGKKIDDKWHDFQVVASWPYRDRTGALLGYVNRIEPEPGKKETLPTTHQVNTETGETKWRRTSLAKPRSLYGAEYLDANPKAQILFIEGEKATDAARRLLAPIFPKHIIPMTWPGGGKAVKHADWSIVAGREAIGWPDIDNKHIPQTGDQIPYLDQPGISTMLAVAGCVEGMRIVDVPEPGTVADGWDLADAEDEGWTFDQLVDYIRNNVVTPDELRARHDAPPVDDAPPMDEIPPEYDTSPERPATSNDPFIPLGWDKGRAFYLIRKTGQVADISAASHTKLNLMQLAPVTYWSERYPSSKKGTDTDWEMAADAQMRQCQSAGIFDVDMIRGRGAWWDDGRSIVHHGGSLTVDGHDIPLNDVQSEYIYEAGRSITIGNSIPLPASEARKLVEFCEGLRWEKPIFGKLLAGWVFLAPICGALDWRPHIWVTGGAGTGKTTVLEHIINRTLKGCRLFVTGDTSEAGIRQRLWRDALPVVFDEFESERKKAAERTQDVLALVTQASSETGAELLKGGAQGKADSYKIRSMFCFSSISVNIEQTAAKSRISVLGMTKVPQSIEERERYSNWKRELFDTLTPEFSAGLQARAIRSIDSIRENAHVFAEAAALVLGEQRTGDQIGTLLAGAYAMYSNGPITREFATSWIEDQNWDSVVTEDTDSDELRCLNHITAHEIRLDHKSGAHKRSVGELILIACAKSPSESILPEDANSELARVGIRVEHGVGEDFAEHHRRTWEVWVANGHPKMAKVLEGTAWAGSWNRTLLRVSGARKLDPQRYAGPTCRGVALPIDAVV